MWSYNVPRTFSDVLAANSIDPNVVDAADNTLAVLVFPKDAHCAVIKNCHPILRCYLIKPVRYNTNNELGTQHQGRSGNHAKTSSLACFRARTTIYHSIKYQGYMQQHPHTMLVLQLPVSVGAIMGVGSMCQR
jgi:hypothetical protein